MTTPTENTASIEGVDDVREGTFASLANPTFRNYMLTLAMSMTGMWVRITAMGYLAYELTDDPFKLGVINVAQSLPQVLLSPVAGIVTDRLDRRRLLLSVQVTITILMIILTAMVAQDAITFNSLVAIAIVLGAIVTFDWPVRLAIVPAMVERKHLSNAVALNSSIFNLAKVIGPTIGGALIAAVGMAWAFGYTTLIQLPFAWVVYRLRHLRLSLSDSNREHPLEALKQGYRYIWRHLPIRTVLSVDAVPILLGMSYLAMAPAFAKDVLGLGGQGLGLLLASNGVGSVLATIVVARLRPRGRGRLVLMGITAFAIMLVAYALSGTVWLSFTLIALLGFAFSFTSTLNDTLVQGLVDDTYRGRVMSIYSMIWGLSPAGALLAGYLARYVGVQWAIAINGVLVLAYVPYLLLRTPLRTID